MRHPRVGGVWIVSPAIDDDSSVGRSRANERTEAVDTSRGRLQQSSPNPARMEAYLSP